MASIASLFVSDVLVNLLTLFVLNPEQSFYQSEIHQRMGGTLYNVQKMLMKLEATDLIIQTKKGKMVYYHANREHPAFEDLKRLLIKTVAIGDMIKNELFNVNHFVQCAFIYGSYARGEESAHSDIDLFILGDLSLRDTSALLGPVMEAIGRELNPTVYSVKEFQQKYKDRNRFVLELLSCPKIWLIGSDDDFKSIAKRG